MRVGFTGTRKGVTTGQLHTFRSFLINEMPAEFHHGCCVGADTAANYEAYNLGIDIVFHPPTNRDYETDLSMYPGIWRPRKPYLERNHDIVDETDWLVAMTQGTKEVLRSGTWATIRYARKRGKPVTIILPSGRIL